MVRAMVRTAVRTPGRMEQGAGRRRPNPSGDASSRTPPAAPDRTALRRATPGLAILLAATGLSTDELPGFCAVAAAMLGGQHGRAHGIAVKLWRSGQRHLIWAPEVRRLVLRTGPWAPGGAAPTAPGDVHAVEDALGLVEDSPARRAWRRELARADAGD